MMQNTWLGMRFVKDGGSTERLGSQIPSTAVLELRNGEMCVFVDDDDHGLFVGRN